MAASYNSWRPMSSMLKLFGIAGALLLITALPLCGADPAQNPPAEFASRILAITGPGSISFNIRNSSPMDADQLRVVQSAIETEVRRQGLNIVAAGNATSDVRVTISQNSHGWLWIAEIQQGPEKKVAMLEVPAITRSSTSGHGSMTLRKQLLFSSDKPILDVLTVNGPAGKSLIALAPLEIMVFQQNAGAWRLQQEIHLERDLPMPRDPRGHLVPATDHLFDAYLPGTVCNSSAALPLAITCRAGDDLWPLGAQNAFFNASRNYFTGLVRPGFAKPLSPFYSAAPVAVADRTTWIFTGVDGRVRWTDGGVEQPLADTSDWGSDIASIRSGCGTGTQLLVTSRGDDSAADSLRAFEIFNRQAAIASAPMSVGGPITALWAATDNSSAVAIVHVIEKGTYEAFSVDLSCN
jgi:hypothetical protein